MGAFQTMPGLPLPLGSTIKGKGVNFALFSRHAEQVTLVLFRSGAEEPVAEILLDPEIHRTGDIWHIQVNGLDDDSRYGYRLAGPHDPFGSGHWYLPELILLDPYARALSGGCRWGDKDLRRPHPEGRASGYQRRACIVDDRYDWEGDRPLNIPLKNSVIYELHVRSFTNHPSAKVNHPGTYRGIIEKIPYLRQLGVTAVELMPVTEFNENELLNHDPETGAPLKNLWGYSPLAFFAPKAAYAADGCNGRQVREFKDMVKALHRAGIEVILDIVFNHTAEGGDDGPVLSFRGIDNTIYYLLDPHERKYLNFSGCGNTFNCNHPLVRNFIMECLRYWVMEMHVDGFRFDLASILGRDTKGEVLSNPPMVEQIAEDPLLANTKIIAEAWDAAGLYQVGSFSTHRRWAEWNGRFRDDLRGFFCGRDNMVASLATRIAGSSDLYQASCRRPYNSINFITSHDGFTLHDLVSYNEKHNLRNGEQNRDGDNNNISWNSGVEGESTDPHLLELRERRKKSLAVLLFLSQGTPMFPAGDEFGRTQKGNNNAYCQDNEISWLDWTLLEKNYALFRFFRLLIALRQGHPVFRRATFFPRPGEGPEEISWHGLHPGKPDWSFASKSLAFLLKGSALPHEEDHDFYVLANGNHKSQLFHLPKPAAGRRWYRVIDSAAPSPEDIVPEGQAPPADSQITVAGLGVVVLISKPPPVAK